MFQAIYNSLSGLFSFSKALDNVSNNVANMNTPGFRGSDTFFADVAGGNGTEIAGQGIITTAGSLNQTGNPTDMAITGEGYFVLRDPSGNLFYTRAGQFQFNDKGILVDSVTNYDVMGIDASGNLTTIDKTAYNLSSPVPTTTVNMTGNINTGTWDPTTGAYTAPVPPNNPITVKYFDNSGTQQTMTLSLQDTTAAITPPATSGNYTFSVTATDSNNNQLFIPPVTLTFNANGTLSSTSATSGQLTFPGGQSITVSFASQSQASDPATAGVGPETLSGTAADGSAPIGYTSYSVDTNGVFQFVYSSADSRSGPQVALAAFPSDSAMQMIGGRLIAGTTAGVKPQIGHANAGVFGSITGGSLELANVDLTQEFADMIVIQRGYQASSRVMTVANEMLQELYQSGQGGG